MPNHQNTRAGEGRPAAGGESHPLSIRSAILSVVVLCILALILVYLVMMGANYRALYQMKETIDGTITFGDYYDARGMLDNALDSFMRNPGEEGALSCRAAMKRLEETSSAMTQTFSDPRYVDNDYLTRALTEQVGLLLEGFSSMNAQEQMEAYNTCDRILGYILDNESFLSARRTQIIQEGCSEQFRVWRKHFAILLSLLLLFALFLMLFASRILHRILDPILELTQMARDFHERIQGGELKAGGGALKMRETQILSEAFDSMAETIRRQMKELQDKIALDEEVHQLQMQNMQMQLSLAEANMQLLQSMISPHFLFNCMSTLAGTAYLEHAPGTRDLALKIAVFLRDSLTLVGKTIPLQEEVRHTEKYIEIQQIRYGERIRFEIQIPEECREIPLPAMLLQPLVENAISHGVKDLWEGARISVEAERRGDECILRVQDNGRGIPEEELEGIRREIEVPFEPGKHTIGLHSVASRIRSAFPKGGSTRILSTPGEGTCIELHIPAQA